MELPSSKREWKLYKELKFMLTNDKSLSFDYAEYHKYKEWLEILVEHGVLIHTRADNCFLYFKETEFNEFELWLKDQNKKAKRVSRREWKIAVVSAIIGAITGAVIPEIIKLLLR